MREIVLDTETTGFDPKEHRVVEIGCIELFNHVATGQEFHCYLNPERDMPAEAEAVHGLSIEFLADKPLFAAVADELLAFVDESPLIAHNANFDMNFINAELKRLSRPPIAAHRAIDTVVLARRKYPGAQASLDALCRRFQIDTSARNKHGALLDAKLLSQVYLELIGGREPGLALAVSETIEITVATQERIIRLPRAHAATPEELTAHTAFVTRLKNPIWQQYAIADVPDGGPAQE
jgi:DNA polymerase-3 subunit epsilon